eukprot:TRINITY_DN67586_c16_g4_i2.p4 TRINITY_DN67586_c16_g4~~TRINITY_DN67586_c16_g4_i2.p4  ORF type:complete len:123 (+),score=20.95 TRINITY_DN67586_c16_g4_i2:805-1173(+)
MPFPEVSVASVAHSAVGPPLLLSFDVAFPYVVTSTEPLTLCQLRTPNENVSTFIGDTWEPAFVTKPPPGDYGANHKFPKWAIVLCGAGGGVLVVTVVGLVLAFRNKIFREQTSLQPLLKGIQ